MASLPLIVEEERRGRKMVQKALFMNSFEMSKMVSLDVSETEDCFHNINLNIRFYFLKIILTKYYIRKIKYKAYF